MRSGGVRHLDPHAVPHADFRDAHAPIRLPAHRDLVQPRSSIQAAAKSVAALLVCANAGNVEVLTDFQPVNAVGNLAVLARLLDALTEVGVSQRNAVLIAARGIDKPCGILNVLGYYSPLLAMLDHAVEERFLKPENRALVLARESPTELLQALEEWRPVPVKKWLDRETR
jgi:hypothetical protein